MTNLKFLTATAEPALLDLPWQLPLENWPEDRIAALPKGISRHTVRFVKLDDHVIAIKETLFDLAKREYEMLRELEKLEVPCVEPFAIVSNRETENGEELPAVLITRHLKYSLPYRAMWSQGIKEQTAKRLVDALAVLLVRLHLIGFFWGDVSLSNTLFRRDAGAFAAYLVDAETGQLYESRLSNGQRANDLEIARVNIAGELMDLVASGKAQDVDPIAISQRIVDKYNTLWTELTEVQSFSGEERFRIAQRVRRLNELGFDIEEMRMESVAGGAELKIQPKVVDAGHHQRRLIRLTGLDVEENQARRLLNQIDEFALRAGDVEDEEMIAHQWLSQIFEPVVNAVPRELRGKLENAELFHEVLDHQWRLANEQKRDVELLEAVQSYVDEVLVNRRDESAYLGTTTEMITLPNPIPSGEVVVDEEEGDWRDLV